MLKNEKEFLDTYKFAKAYKLAKSKHNLNSVDKVYNHLSARFDTYGFESSFNREQFNEWLKNARIVGKGIVATPEAVKKAFYETKINTQKYRDSYNASKEANSEAKSEVWSGRRRIALVSGIMASPIITGIAFGIGAIFAPALVWPAAIIGGIGLVADFIVAKPVSRWFSKLAQSIKRNKAILKGPKSLLGSNKNLANAASRVYNNQFEAENIINGTQRDTSVANEYEFDPVFQELNSYVPGKTPAVKPVEKSKPVEEKEKPVEKLVVKTWEEENPEKANEIKEYNKTVPEKDRLSLSEEGYAKLKEIKEPAIGADEGVKWEENPANEDKVKKINAFNKEKLPKGEKPIGYSDEEYTRMETLIEKFEKKKRDEEETLE